MAKTVVLIGFVASLLFVSLIAYSFPVFAQGPDFAPGLDKIRVIAHDGDELSNAIANGCKVVRDAGPLKGVICNPKVAESLGLKKDLRLFALDTDANTQIGANLVHSTNTGEGTKIAILDTGYDYNNQDLSSSYIDGYDFVNDDDDPLDDNGHGSHVAGIITSDGIDLRSIGVAPATGVYSYKVLDENGSGYFSDTLAAFQSVVWGPDNTFGTSDDNSIDVDAISLSLGSSKPNVWKGSCDTVWPEMTSVIQQARSNGIAVVIAAGNEGKAGVSFPGCISYAITVAAVDDRDKVARFSSVGTAVDIAAPGVSIYSTLLVDKNGLSLYGTKSGTSMSTPMITGTVALMKSANNVLSVDDIESALFNTATDLGDSGKDSKSGHGRVNANLAVAYSPGPINNSPTADAGPDQNVDVESTVTLDGRGSDDPDGDNLLLTYGWTQTAGTITVILDLTDPAQPTFTAPSSADTLEFQLTVSNGEFSNSDNVVITVETVENPPPGNLDSQIEFDVQSKKRFNNLLVTIVATESASSVSNVPVELTLSRVGASWNFSGITDESGSVTFTLMKARSYENYTATITNWSDVFAAGEESDCNYIDDKDDPKPC